MSGVTAIVPVWNGRALLEKLLAALERQTRPADELLVVDNGSVDGAPEMARDRGARVISMGRNTGFAAAVNRGIRESGGEWIAVFNSDVEPAPDYLETLRAAAEREDAWFATGKILTAGTKDRIDGTFDALSRGATAWRVGSGRSDGPVFSSPRAIFSAPWTAALFRAELFRRVGMLESRFESYLEDVDFGLRCAARGLGGVYVPAAVAWHRGSATLGRWHPETVRRISRNQVFLIARHYPRRAIFRWLWPICVAQLAWGVVAARHFGAGPWLRGKWEGLRAFRSVRRDISPFDPAVLDGLLRENEIAIHRAQAATGFDPYWRLYFLLTGGGAK
jgi:GT2 family glycosyltransferase